MILSYYFPPDLSAGSFRCKALVDALKDEAPDSINIHIITTTPNQYDSFTDNSRQREQTDHCTVSRCKVGKHGGNLLAQCLSFLAYTLYVRKITSTQDYDCIIATSSRLMTATLAAHIAKTKNIPVFLDIRDIFTDSVQNIVPIYLKKPIIKFFEALERYTIEESNWINLVSPGFSDYFEPRFPEKSFNYFTNGIDGEFISNRSKEACFRNTEGVLRIVYAGNIGDGQGLDRIIPQMALEGEGLLRFLVIGDGSRKSALEKEIIKLDLKNVELRTPVARSELLKIYSEADVLFLHLNIFEAFNKVLPSKIFEYAATGRPILAGVGGFPKKFILNNVINCGVFEPGNPTSAITALSKLSLGNTNRQKFISKYSRENIMRKMAKSVFKAYLNG